MIQRPVVLVTEPIHPAGQSLLESEAKVIRPAKPTEEQVLPLLADADGVIVRLFPVGAHIIEKAPKLRVIGRHGAGVDTVDVAAAEARGIVVVYTPEANADSVAEYAITLLLALARRLRAADQSARARDWSSRGRLTGTELRGKTLGVVGLGRIGRRVAEIAAQGFGMRVIAFDPYIMKTTDERPETRDQRQETVGQAPPHVIRHPGSAIRLCASLDELLEQADAITLHVPLTAETRNMMGAAALSRMEPGALLVNTSRGEVVDEAALAEVLQIGRLGGAALDVFATEPPDAESPLLTLGNVILSPHIASSTAEALERMAVTVAADVLRVLRGEEPLYRV